MKALHQTLALKLTAVLGALGIALGAFGAHGLADLLVQYGRVATWETAALYHLVHAVGLLVLATAKSWRPVAWLAIAAGVCIFSGSLYLLCLTQVGWLGAVTPIGGALLIAGWLSLAFSVNHSEQK